METKQKVKYDRITIKIQLDGDTATTVDMWQKFFQEQVEPLQYANPVVEIERGGE